MIRNYLKIAFRSLLRFKGYSVINLLGLSLGLTCGTVILLFVLDEFSYDQFHANKDRIYRVVTAFSASEKENTGTIETNGWPIGKILEKEYPEVEAVTYARYSSLPITYEGRKFKQRNFYVTPEFLKIFSFPLKEGDATTALTEPFSVVISEDMAKKFFPDQDALNKTLMMSDSLNFKVTGVMANIPGNSHIQADMFLSFTTYQRLEKSFSFDDGWGNLNVRNYILLKPGSDFKNFSAKALNIYNDKVGEQMKKMGMQALVKFEPLPEIYLHSKSGNGMGPLGSIDRVYLLSGVAFFVILLACINFINLSTARSAYRSKEVGLRKAVGSSRQSLILQFLSEASVITVVSLIISFAFTGLLLPFFNQLLDKNYQLNILWQPNVLLGAAALTVIVSIMAGYYPAVVISSLKPSEVLKGKLQSSKRGVNLRRGLVIFQFMISVSLVTATLIVIDQLNFMQKQSLGFNKDQIIILHTAFVNIRNKQPFETFKKELQSQSIVSNTTYANGVPGTAGWQGQIAYPKGKSSSTSIEVEYIAADENYIQTLGLQLIAGRGFSKDHSADLDNGLVLNEEAVKQFGWASPEEAIGKEIDSPSGSPAGEVIGVVKDYHQHGLQHKIEPITIGYRSNFSYLCAVRYQAANTQQVISTAESLWKKSFPGFDFNYSFLDDSFESQYQSEKRLASVFALFSIVTILIAVIGLLGLVSFMVVTRTKEIGIRKVLGADVFSITRLLTKDFIWLVVAANILSAPLIWYFANQWLNKFAYKMVLTPVTLVVVLMLAVSLTVIVVSIQSVKASLANPVDSLRSE